MTAFPRRASLDFKTQYGLGFSSQDDEIIVDFFCGGGGAGTGLEMGLGRPVAVAKNHSAAAISMHTANHPAARHFTTDVFDGDPDAECAGRPVGWFHMSPDCTHHSQAAGGQPRKREIRNLSWVGLKWAGKKRPRVISLENVKQILQWGPLIAKRCKATGRVMKVDGTVAAQGERVPVRQQFLVPDPKRKGQTWRRFVQLLEGMGYQVEWQVGRACDYGAPTSRERLFMIARCDGQPIVWPAPTHAKVPGKGQKPWRSAAECIDWTIPCPSIFDRKKPLADATLRRVAKGMRKFVLDAAAPFIVPIANWSREASLSTAEPLHTVTAWPRGGSFAVASPTLVGLGGPAYAGKPADVAAPLGSILTENHRAIAAPVLVQAAYGEGKPGGVRRWGSGSRNIAQPVGAVTASGSGGQSVAVAFLEQANGGFNTTPAHSVTRPMTTATNSGSQQRLAVASLATLRRNCTGQPLTSQVPAITAGAEHHALVQYELAPEVEAGALHVAAFLMSYYGTDNTSRPDEPAPTVTTKDRLALVTVTIQGTPYVVVDIGLRMLQPRELYRAQGFPDGYQIDRGADGKAFTKSQQVHMCGNSVSPPHMAAIARANDPWRAAAMEPSKTAAA